MLSYFYVAFDNEPNSTLRIVCANVVESQLGLDTQHWTGMKN